MKKKLYLSVIISEITAIIALSIFKNDIFLNPAMLLSFPFEQMGMGLRALSLSGPIGNLAALALYIAICLSPASILLVIKARRGLCFEDSLLGMLSIALFISLYYMINPSPIGQAGAAFGQAAMKAAFGAALYSIITAYIILSSLRLFIKSPVKKLIKHMGAMLFILGMLFAYAAFGGLYSGIFSPISALGAIGAFNQGIKWPYYIFICANFLLKALPYALGMIVSYYALGLLGILDISRYSAESVAAAEHMSSFCVKALAMSVIANMASNIFQLFFIGRYTAVNISVDIPLASIAFILAALIATRLIAEGKKIKDDNSLFI